MYKPAHLEKLNASLIPTTAAIRAGITSVEPAEVARAVFGPGEEGSIPGDALRIPYLELSGLPMLDDTGVPYARFRVFDQRKDIPKPFRYTARPDSGSRPYLPAGLADLLPTAEFLIVTEGELKALAGVANGLACAGISGVTMWAAPSATGSRLSEDTPVHPELLKLATLVNSVVVLADSDAAQNEEVRRHMQTLAAAIKKQCLGVTCIYARCKDAKELKTKVQKIGLDDWLFHTNGNTKSIESLLTYKLEKTRERESALDSGGYVPLGYSDGGVYHVWSNPRAQTEAMSAATLGRPSELMSLTGAKWALAAYPKFNKEGDALSPDWSALAGDLMAGCVDSGLFRVDRVRGAGVWLEEDGYPVVNSDTNSIWSPSAAVIGRVTEKHVYIKTRSLGVTPDTPPASLEDVKNVRDALCSFNFERTSDPRLLLGLVMLGFVPGALSWRPHAFVHGVGGAGKSYLLRFLKTLLGGAAELSESQSEAGLRQLIKHDSITVICDETEADGQTIGRLLEFFRLAASGARKNMGTADQKGLSFTLRAMGIVAGIVPPSLQSQDESRFIKISMHPVDLSVRNTPHVLFADHDETQAIGRRLFALMLQRWTLFQATMKTVFSLLKGSSRMADVIAPVIAGAYVAEHDPANPLEVAHYVALFDLSEDMARISGTSDTDDFTSHLFGVRIDLDIDGKRLAMSVSSACARALASKDVRNALGVYGLCPVAENGAHRLRIDYKSPQFRALFRGTKWEKGALEEMLKKVPGGDRKTLDKRHRFGAGGAPRVYLSVPFDFEAPEQVAGPLPSSSLGL